MKIISSLILTVLLLQNCTFYKKAPVTLNYALNRGKVKVKTPGGKSYIFDQINKDSAGYYGKLQVWYSGRVQLDSTVSRSIYLTKKNTSINEVWVELKNASELRGVLYEVTDSSIWIIAKIDNNYLLNTVDNITDKTNATELLATDISKIFLRKVTKVGKSAGIGSLVGAGALIGLGYFLGGYTWGTANFIFGTGFGVVGTAAGAFIGATVGSLRKKYLIDGNASTFQKYQIELRSRSVKYLP